MSAFLDSLEKSLNPIPAITAIVSLPATLAANNLNIMTGGTTKSIDNVSTAVSDGAKQLSGVIPTVLGDMGTGVNRGLNNALDGALPELGANQRPEGEAGISTNMMIMIGVGMAGVAAVLIVSQKKKNIQRS